MLAADVDLVDGGTIPVSHGPYRLYQYADKAYSKRFFNADSSDARSNLAKMLRFIEHHARIHSTVLVICQQPIELKLRDMGLPSNVLIEHFNAIRGKDVYKTVPCAIIIGRSQPKPADLEIMAEALHYDNPSVLHLEHGTDRIGEEKRVLRLDDGHLATVYAASHPDVHVRAIQRQIVDAEVKQALHRLRLFDRTEETAPEIHLFGQTDTGLSVKRLMDWKDADYDMADHILEKGVISYDIKAWGPYKAKATKDGYVMKALDRGARAWPVYRVALVGFGLVKARLDPSRDPHELVRDAFEYPVASLTRMKD
jgi:hypothetical protein